MQNKLDGESERRDTSELLDVLVRAGLILALAALCYQVFAPFLTLMVWAVILAVALYRATSTSRTRSEQGRDWQRRHGSSSASP